MDLQTGVWNKRAAKSKRSQEEPYAEERDSEGCLFLGCAPSKTTKVFRKLWNRGMGAPLLWEEDSLPRNQRLPSCSGATNPGMPCSAPLETDNAKPRGWLWEICYSVLFAPNSQVGLPAEMSGSLDSLRAPQERLLGTAARHLLQGALAGLGRCLQHPPGEPPLEQQGQASCLSRI